MQPKIKKKNNLKKKKKNLGHSFGNFKSLEVKFSLFTDDITLYVERPPKNSTKKLMYKHFQQSSRIQRQHKNHLRFCKLTMNNPNGKLRKQFYYNRIKRIKYLRINLIKEVKDLYNENYNTLLKNIKEDIHGEVHGLEALILLRCQYYRFKNISMIFFA